jgi:hypothetical protein
MKTEQGEENNKWKGKEQSGGRKDQNTNRGVCGEKNKKQKRKNILTRVGTCPEKSLITSEHTRKASNILSGNRSEVP